MNHRLCLRYYAASANSSDPLRIQQQSASLCMESTCASYNMWQQSEHMLSTRKYNQTIKNAHICVRHSVFRIIKISIIVFVYIIWQNRHIVVLTSRAISLYGKLRLQYIIIDVSCELTSITYSRRFRLCKH